MRLHPRYFDISQHCPLLQARHQLVVVVRRLKVPARMLVASHEHLFSVPTRGRAHLRLQVAMTSPLLSLHTHVRMEQTQQPAGHFVTQLERSISIHSNRPPARTCNHEWLVGCGSTKHLPLRLLPSPQGCIQCGRSLPLRGQQTLPGQGVSTSKMWQEGTKSPKPPGWYCPP